jgi:hypothetical protein
MATAYYHTDSLQTVGAGRSGLAPRHCSDGNVLTSICAVFLNRSFGLIT